jgi:hypothetical protein
MSMISPDALSGKSEEDDWARATAKIEAWAAVMAGGSAGKMSNPRLRKAKNTITTVGSQLLRKGGIAINVTGNVAGSVGNYLPTLASAGGSVAGALAPVLLPLNMVVAVYTGYRMYRLINRTFDMQYLSGVASIHWSRKPSWNCRQATIDVLEYAVRQSAKRTARVGVGIVPGLGLVSMLATGARAVYKWKKNKLHAKRNLSADGLMAAMDDSDAPAWALATELVGLQTLLELTAHATVDGGDKLRAGIYGGLQGR